MGLSYKTDRWTAGVDLFNLANSKDYDIAYWYSSRLMSEVLPVEDIHFHPVNPRSIRVGREYRFKMFMSVRLKVTGIVKLMLGSPAIYLSFSRPSVTRSWPAERTTGAIVLTVTF